MPLVSAQMTRIQLHGALELLLGSSPVPVIEDFNTAKGGVGVRLWNLRYGRRFVLCPCELFVFVAVRECRFTHGV